MVDPTAEETLSSTLESSLCDDVQALFKDMNSQKGTLAWSLQRKVEDNPSCSVSLIPILVKKLEETLTKVSKSQEKESYIPIIPVLHTLYYVVIQSGVMLHESLYHNVYDCLVKLLILPSPYSAVALQTLRSIKMEMTAPGSLCLKRVIAEQNMKNEHFVMQEKVFVLADPAVFSAPLEATVKAYLNVPSWLRNTQTMEKTVLFHVLQTGLEMTCQSSRLVQALEVLEDRAVKEYFQDVVQAVNQCLNDGPGGRGHYLNQLKQINKSILAASNKEIINGDQDSVYSTTMPLPEIKFLTWKDEEILWDLLAEFTLNSGSQRLSRDSGIMKNPNVTDSDDTEQPPDRIPKQPERRNAWKRKQLLDQLILMTEKIEVGTGNASLRKEERSHTARVVIMGNDCTLGRLTRAYYAIREKESKRNMLTKKLDLQLYYIPVSGVEPSLSSPDDSRLSLASCLDRVDPWYSVNISSLGAVIPSLPELPPVYNKPSELNLYLLDTMCYYLRCGTQPVNFPVYSVKMTPCNSDATSVEELFVSHLEADIPEFRHLKDQHLKEPSVRQKKSSVELFGGVLSVSYTKTSMSKRDVKGEASMTWRAVMTSEPAASASGENYLIARFDSLNPAYNTKIQTQNISIKTMEHRTLCVCLDKDPSRTYTDIQRIEISPCLDPGCNIRSRRSIDNERELPLNKYLDKVLSVPINTFSGVTI